MSLTRGSCWDVLELEKTEDKKLIKRAYHKLLRKYKPDEKPNEFKILYQAYEDALAYEAWYDDDDEEEIWGDRLLEQEKHPEDDEDDNNVDNYELTKEEELQSENYDEYWRRWEIFEEEVDKLTYDNNYPELFNKVENWQFIETLNLENDLELHQRAAHYLFTAISDFDENNTKILLNDKVINYLNRLFLWEKYWQEYDSNSSIFEYFSISKVRPNPKQLPQYPLASVEERLAAFFIDMLIAGSIGFFIESSFEGVILFYLFIHLILFVVIGYRTPGQLMIKLKVFEGEEYERPSKIARAIRLIFTGLSLLALYLISQEPASVQPLPYLFLGFSIGLYLRDRRILADWSGTRIYSLSETVEP